MCLGPFRATGTLRRFALGRRRRAVWLGSPSDLSRERAAWHQTRHIVACCYDTTLSAMGTAYGRYDAAMRTIETLESEVLKMKLRMDSMFTHDQLNKRIKVSFYMSYDTSHALCCICTCHECSCASGSPRASTLGSPLPHLHRDWARPARQACACTLSSVLTSITRARHALKQTRMQALREECLASVAKVMQGKVKPAEPYSTLCYPSPTKM